MRALLLSCALLLASCGDADRAPDAQARSVAATRGPVSATAVLTPESPAAGEHMQLVVQVEAEGGVDVQTPLLAWEDDAIGPFNVLGSADDPDLPLPEGRRGWRQTLTLDSFETGELELPALHVAFVDRRGTPEIEGFLTLPIIDVTVSTSLTESDTGLRAMRDERPLPAGPTSPWWWLMLPGAIALIVGGFMWSRRGWAKALAPLTPAQRARRDLTRLEQEGLLAAGASEPYFASVSDIVRRYLEDGLGLRAPRATTREFLMEAERSTVLEAGQRATLHDLLALADLVKFARHAPDADTGVQAMHTALAFVDATDAGEGELAGGAA